MLNGLRAGTAPLSTTFPGSSSLALGVWAIVHVSYQKSSWPLGGVGLVVHAAEPLQGGS